MADRVTVAEEYREVRSRAGAFDLRRDFVRVAGPEATTFLQGQLSQDVAALAVGSSAWSLLLSPQGKMVALLRAYRSAESEWVLDSDEATGPTVVERLQRFKLRVRCDVEPLGWSCVALRGPSARVLAPSARGALVVADWPGLDGLDVVGDDPAPPEGVRRCSLDTYEVVRIEAGIPRAGREIDEGTIPAEAGVVERSVSFTKGCYTGQELVARIDSRGGNVPRRLRGVVAAGTGEVPVGAAVVVGGAEMGRVTSSAWSPARQGAVGLAYVKRAVEPPVAASLSWEGGEAAADVVPLPIGG